MPMIPNVFEEDAATEWGYLKGLDVDVYAVLLPGIGTNAV
jgi:hypothetical protein